MREYTNRMSKVLCLGDLHFRSKDFYLRLNLYKEILSTNRKKISYVVNTGDLFDSPSVGDIRSVPTPDMISAISKVHRDLDLPMYVIAGNHDTSAGVQALKLFDGDKFIIPMHTPTLMCIDDVSVFFVPWMSGCLKSKDYVKRILKKNKEGVKYVFIHSDFVGASFNQFVTEDEKHSLWCFKPDDMCGVTTIASHVHSPQSLDSVDYIGTIEQLSFSEEGNVNRYLILDLATGKKDYRTVNAGQKYYSIYDLSQLPPKGSHVRLFAEENAPKAVRDEYLSWKLVKKHETVERKDVIEIEDEVPSAETLYKKYCEITTETPMECNEELCELNSIISSFTTKNSGGVNRFHSFTSENIGKLKNRTFLFSEGMNLIYGANASGKSSTLEGLYATLYGIYPYTGRTNLNSLMNASTASLSVCAEASDGSLHNVHREITVTGSKGKIDDGKLMLKTPMDQECEAIFGSKDIAGRVCVLDQKQTFDLVGKIESERMLALRDILGLDYFYELEKYISEKLKGHVKEELLNDRIESLSVSLKNLSTEEEGLLAKIGQTQSAVDGYRAYMLSLQEEKTTKYSPEAFRHVYNIGEIRDFNLFRNEVQAMDAALVDLERKEQEYAELKKESSYSCERCGYSKDIAHRLAEMKELTATASEIHRKLKYDIVQKYKLTHVKSAEASIPYVEKNFLVEEISTFQLGANQNSKQISSTDEALRAATFSLGKLTADLERVPKTREALDKQIQEAVEDRRRNKVWSHLSQVFGKRGVCNFLIASAVNDMQIIVDELLNASDLGISIELSTQKEKKSGFAETLQILLKNEDGKQYDARSASGGELDMIRVILRLAISRYLQRKAVKYRVLLLDEPSAAMDSDKTRSLFKLILTQKKYFKQIICVSHSDTLLEFADTVIYL